MPTKPPTVTTAKTHEPTRTGLAADTLKQAVLDNLVYTLARLPEIATSHDWYRALACSVRDRRGPPASMREQAASALAVEPAGAAARAEVLLVGGERGGRLVVGAGWLRSGEEVHLHATDTASAELDVADTAPVIGSRLLTAAYARDQRGSDDACRSLGEHSRLRHPGSRDLTDRKDSGDQHLETNQYDYELIELTGT